MRARMFPLICLVVVVAVIAITQTGLTANQSDWTDRKGGAPCTYDNNNCKAPSTPASCGSCLAGCDDKESHDGRNGPCENKGFFTGRTDIGLQACGHKQKKKRVCEANWVWIDCHCRTDDIYEHGSDLFRCSISSC